MDALTIAQAQINLDNAWAAHQAALDSGNTRKISKASKTIVAAAQDLRRAQNHAAMDAHIARR